MHQLLIELVEHAEKDKSNCDPLSSVCVVIINKNTEYNCQYFTSRADQRKNMLFKICNYVVYTNLTQNLQ
jgi:hypothetical protein